MDIKTDKLRHITLDTELCIIGGGLSGMIAAISAAREGTRVVLIQDRPVLGGNCSSEVRMWVRGASGNHNRETGVISELEAENIYRNPTLKYSIWDSVLWGKVKAEENITLLLNCTCVDADCKDDTVKCVKGWQMTTYTWYTVYAKYFADCSGDSILAPIVGALYRVGREGHSEFGETMGPEKSDRKTMGMSCLMQATETDHKVTYIPPKWANVYENDDAFTFAPNEGTGELIIDADFEQRTKNGNAKTTQRIHTLETSGVNFWWMELGGEADSIHDTETIRDELLKVAFGVWDHIKNRGDHGADNWDLEWVGFLPGKRESRRYVGAHILTQSDIEAEGRFDDMIAFGGWTMDDHHPGGINTPRNLSPSLLHPAPSPYGIPYRCLYSKNIKNLFFAGRNISATHAANSSTRVMATCSLLGQAMGIAASMCIRENLTPGEIYEKKIRELQKKLLDAGCYLPWHTREIPALATGAEINLSDGDKALLFNGIERPDEKGTKNFVTLKNGESIDFDFGEEKSLGELRIAFDPDFSRMSISKNKKMRVFTLKCNTGKDFSPVTVANTLVKSFAVYADGECVYEESENYLPLVRIPLNISARKLSVKFTQTWGLDEVHIFSCDVTEK